MDRRSFEALAKRSRHDGIPIAGDLPDSIPAPLAAEDRMISIDNLFGVGLACSSQQEQLRARLLAAKSHSSQAERDAIEAAMIGTYDPSAVGKLWDLFRRYGVRQTPMLTRWSRLASGDVHTAADANWSEPEQGLGAEMWAFALKLTGEMARAGVPILAGTDTGDPGTTPGVELHRELQLLVRAGLTPLEALRAATLEPAAVLRRDGDSGQVKKGFIADLVVLRANPLDDIANIGDIEEVFARGKRIDRTGIAHLLAGQSK